MAPKTDQSRCSARVLIGVGIFNRFEKAQPLNLANLIGDSGAQIVWNARLNSAQVVQNLVNFSLICAVGQGIGVTERLVSGNACVQTVVFSTGIFRSVLRAETGVVQTGLNSTKLIHIVAGVVDLGKGLVENELLALLIIWSCVGLFIIWSRAFDTGCRNDVGKSI